MPATRRDRETALVFIGPIEDALSLKLGVMIGASTTNRTNFRIRTLEQDFRPNHWAFASANEQTAAMAVLMDWRS
jgi:hypothetical protein